MRVRKAWLLVLFSFAVFSLAVPAGALPAVLEQAKKQGVVGEQANGYLGLVKGKKGGAQVGEALKQVNDQRRELYKQRAAKKGTDLKTYAAVVGAKQIGREPKGNWVKSSQGWIQK